VYVAGVPASTALIDLRGDSLPGDVAVIRYEAREAISRPFEIDVEFSTADAGFQADACLRKSVLLTLIDAVQGQRLFHGIVDRAEFSYYTGTHFHFRVRMRPALAALAHREGCKIYQDQNLVDILQAVFADAGVDKVEFQLQNEYEAREYVVQYRESELNFVQRLMEDEGVFYFFRHKPEEHTMIITDDPSAFVPSDDAPEVAFSMGQGMASGFCWGFSKS
jgi:type VI secretion system secreted protein VgrG